MSPDKLAKISTILSKPPKKLAFNLRACNSTYTNVWDTIEAGWETTSPGTTSFSPVFHGKLILNVGLLISKGDSISSKLLKANVTIFGQFDAVSILVSSSLC